MGFSEIGVCYDNAGEQPERAYFACLCTCINTYLCECCVAMSMCL